MSNQVDKVLDANRPLLSRGQLQGIEDDPAKMETLARLLGAVNLDNLFRQMQHENTNLGLKLEFQKMLNKMGRLEPEATGLRGAGPQVIINITRARNDGGANGITIEGTATPTPED